MIESVRELRGLVGKQGYENNIYHICSPYLTRIFLVSGCNADQVSFLGFLCGMLACLFFVFPFPMFYISGGFLLFLGMVCDCCDGEISRYNNTQYSVFGNFFDWFGQQYKGFIPVCLSIGFMVLYPRFVFLLCGLIFSGFCFFNTTVSGLFKHISSYFVDITTIKYSGSRLFGIHYFIRFSHRATILPFLFLFSGCVDLVSGGFPISVFLLWLYLGVSSIFLFFIELVLRGRYR